MPFQSEKQRRYLWANEPEIAREWTNRYGANQGGITRLPFRNGLGVGERMTEIGTPMPDWMWSSPQFRQGIDNSMYGGDRKLFGTDAQGMDYYTGDTFPPGHPNVPNTGEGITRYEFDDDQGEPEMDIEDFQNLNNRGIMENRHINELSDVYSPSKDYGQFFRQQPVDEYVPWHQQGTLKDVFQAEDFPLRDNIAKTKQGLGELWQKGRDLGETAWGGIENIGSLAKKHTLGLASMVAKGVDQFDQLPMADQLFISQQMGGKGGELGQGVYKDPQSGLLKDVGGVNVRSLFGNYADAVHKEFNRYDKNIKSSEEKYDVTYNEDTGLFEGANAARVNKANQMTKRNRYMYQQYSVKKQQQQKLAADYGRDQQRKENAAQAKREREARERQEATRTYGDAGQNINQGSGGGHGYDPQHDYSGTSTQARHERSSDLGFSDIRLKDNVELIGKSPSNINIYKFNYLNDPTVYQGVMAQEVPWASVKADNGYLMVDYNKVDVDFKKWHKR